MTPELANTAARLVVEKIGFDIRARIDTKGSDSELWFWPADHDYRESFRIRIAFGLHSAEGHLELGTFAKDVLVALSNPSEQGLLSFSAFARGLHTQNLRLQIKINDQEVLAENIESKWPSTISQFEIRVGKNHLVFDRNLDSDLLNLVDMLVVPVFGMMGALLGTQEVEVSGNLEGAKYQTYVTLHERSKTNREACLRFYGAKCQVCGFDFSKIYGSLLDGFIEVHHRERVADYGGERPVDPLRDLVPLCSNCHSVAHKRVPPFDIEEIQSMIETAKFQDGPK